MSEHKSETTTPNETSDRQAVGNAPVASGQDADAPRFSIAHGMIHDAVTGKHVTTAPDDEDWNGGTISGCLDLLNELDRLRNAAHAANQSPRSAPSLGANDYRYLVQNSTATPTEATPVPHDEMLEEFEKEHPFFKAGFEMGQKMVAPIPHDAVVPDGWKLVAEELYSALSMRLKNEQVRDGIKNHDGSFPRAWDGKFVEENTKAAIALYRATLSAPPATLETASAVRDRALEEAASLVEKLWDKGISHKESAIAIRALISQPVKS